MYIGNYKLKAYAKTWSGVKPWGGVMEWCGFFGVVFWSGFFESSLRSFKVRR